jgi:hypothetical protein
MAKKAKTEENNSEEEPKQGFFFLFLHCMFFRDSDAANKDERERPDRSTNYHQRVISDRVIGMAELENPTLKCLSI